MKRVDQPRPRIRRRSLGAGALILILAAAGTTSLLRASAQQGAQSEISPEALAQIDALIRDKESRSATEQKMDSQLIYELRMRGGGQAAPGVQTLETDLPYADDGHVVLDAKALVSPELLATLRGLGAEILSSTNETLRMHLDVAAVGAVAALPDIIFIGPKQDAMTMSATMGQGRQATADEWIRGRHARRAKRAADLAAFLRSARVAQQEVNAGTGVGSQSSEGDVAHRANAARGSFGVNGSGIKIGVLSDGVRNLAASQALGDLGPVTVIGVPAPCPAANTCDEGTAMLEIVHDVAPGAQLYFASAFVDIVTFANNIRALRTAGCDIIVDDVFYFVETPFQDGQAASVISSTNGGVVIQAVKDVTAAGAIYFSSAGNSGNVNDGTGGTWEGDFLDGGATAAPLPAPGAGRLHSFGAQTFNSLTLVNANAPINLFWSDPLGGSANDYDLFRLNAAGTAVIGSSTNIQNGTQDPIEQVNQSATSPRLVIVKKNAALPRFLHLETNRGRLSITTPGTTHGHSTVDDIGAYGVAATPAVGPFPNAFNPANVVETFSSDGPRRIFFDGAGNAITPGNLLAGGGKLLNKPDITAADGVAVTGVGGFPNPFFGTSAAAPHAAAIAALLKQANPAMTQAQMRTALTSTAIDIEAPGFDRDSGAGIIMPVAALLSAGIPGTAFLQLGNVAATENPGDANGTINAGEGASLAIQLLNLGVLDATVVSATLTTSTPDITVTQPGTSPYANIVAYTGSQLNGGPLLFTVASTAPCPQLANFALNVTYTGGSTSLPFSLPLGTRTITINSTLDATAPTSTLFFTGATGTQTGRINRLTPPSSCAAPKPFPGLAATTGLRQVDSFAFNTCATSAPSCVQVTMVNNAVGAPAALFDVAYVPSFTSSNLATGYAGDPAASQIAGGPISFAFALPGGSPFSIAVHEVNPGLGLTANYSLALTGACFGNCSAPNAVPIARAKSVTVSASPLTCGAAASVDDGSSDPDGDPLTITQSPPGPYALGTTSVLLTVVDPRGATSQATGSVTVVDTSAPDITCPSPITVPASPGTCGATVLFTPTATDICSPPATILSVPPSGSIFPVGTTTVVSTATDAVGNAASCNLPITVLDQQPPVVTNVSVSSPSLWPPDHKMVDVTVNYDLVDNCGASCVLSVTSNEAINGLGDGDTAPDWAIVDAHHVKIRAERSGGGNGRTYTIKLTCTDASGNATIKTTTVVVPH